MSASSEVFLFGEFRLDRAGGGLFRRDDHGAFVPVTIGSRALEILAALVERRGDIVSKEEIKGTGWPRTVVAESNLFVQIAALRRILDARQSGQSCIQTVIGRGYRFIAPVTRYEVRMEYSASLADGRSPDPQRSFAASTERRQLTVMTCELVGAASLAVRLDPEDLREIIAAYRRAIAEIAAGFDGLIGKYMSDGAMVYFGYPRAHEDDGERAVRAGLEAIDAVGRLDVGAGKLQARVGIATGLVVVGDPVGEGPAGEQSVFGEAPHLAAGLQALAEPDTVVIAAGTRRLVGALFEFSYALLRAVSGLPEDALEAFLDRLVASELVFQRGTPPDAMYTFKHALVQDAAHDSLLRRSRQQLHAQIAEALETHSPELMQSQPEIFAQHYARAGLIEKSVVCWSKAGYRSATRSAMTEAAAQFQKGLTQLALLRDTPERQQQELELRSALGAVLQAVKGFAAPETGHTYARARELWEQLGSPLQHVRITFGQSRYYWVCGEQDLALRLDEDVIRLSSQRNDSTGLVLGHLSSGRNLMWAGRFASSRSRLEKVLALYDPMSHSSLAYQIGIYPQVVSQAYLGIVLFCLGYPDQASSRSNAVIAEARRLAHMPSFAHCLAFGARLHSLDGDDTALGERAGELIAVATEQSFPEWRGYGVSYRGWAKVKNGDVADGISLLRRGSTALHATGREDGDPHSLTHLAKACEIAGQTEEAVTLLDDALRIIDRRGQHWFAAEANRHKGGLLLRQGQAAAAEDLYRKALSIAREQGAKLWELRAAVSLARLRRDQGRRGEGRDLLAPIYDWFTEGFDTPDLKKAKVLLKGFDA